VKAKQDTFIKLKKAKLLANLKLGSEIPKYGRHIYSASGKSA
jgi:hypothetical protein